MTNTEKYAFPLVIGAAILSVWAALRRTDGSGPVAVTTAGLPSAGAGLPAIPPLEQYLAPVPAPGSANAPAGSGVGTNRNWVGAARDFVWANNPLNPDGSQVPGRITFNLPSWSDSTKHAAAVASAPAPAGGGCSGGCGGCGGKKSGGCEQRSDSGNNRFPDGRGGCLTTKLKFGNVQPALDNAGQYAGQYFTGNWNQAAAAYEQSRSA